jgi:hypothetical protein
MKSFKFLCSGVLWYSILNKVNIVILLSIYLSVCLSVYLSMTLQPFVGPWPLFQSIDLFTQSVGLTGCRPIARPLPADRTA